MLREGLARIAAAALAVFLLLSPGCEDPATTPEPDLGIIGGIQTNQTDPASLITAHAAATTARNLAAYVALLESPSGDSDGFRFYPRNDDLQDFPWIQGTSWSHSVETEIMTHMFDPEFSRPGNDPVQSIMMALEVTSQEDLGDGAHQLTCSCDVEVLVGPNEGWRSDTGFVVTLATVDGFLRIREIREVSPFKSGRTLVSTEDSSWGTIKGLYR